MRKNTKNASTNPEIAKQYVSSERSKMKMTYYSRRAKGKLAKSLAFTMYAGILAVSGYLGLIYAQKSDEVGYVGVIGSLADGAALSCGGEYDASSIALIHPTLPCGSQVRVSNPENGRQAVATVASNAVAFASGNGRTADISEGLANELGLDTEAVVPAVLALRPYGSFTKYLPMWPEYHAAVPEVPEADPASRRSLTQNLIGECAVCGENGMVAVAQVSLNRLDQRFNGKATLPAVIFDRAQFSWTLADESLWPNESRRGWKKANVLSGAILTDQLSGELLAVQYLVTRDATYYYAPDVIKTPYWGKRGGALEVVPMSNTKEVALWHRFYREKGVSLPAVASRNVTKASAVVTEVAEAKTSKAKAKHATLPEIGPVPAKKPKQDEPADELAELIRKAN